MSVKEGESSPLFLKYKKLYEADPRSLVFAPLGELYRKIGLEERAIEILKQGLKVHPTYILGIQTLAQCYADLEQYTLAYNTLLPFVHTTKENIKFQKLYAELCVKRELYEEALNTYKFLLYINPKDQESSQAILEIESRVEVVRGVESLNREETAYYLPPLQEDEWTPLSLPRVSEERPLPSAKEIAIAPLTKEEGRVTFTLVDLYLAKGKSALAKELLLKMEELMPQDSEIKSRLKNLEGEISKEVNDLEVEETIQSLLSFKERLLERSRIREHC